MDEASIIRHAQPWQQMLISSARTQREHTWQSSKNRFTRRKLAAWDPFVQAGRGVDDVDEMDITK
jgi:hypothetical protein